MDQPGTVSSVGIARLAGVGRAAVSNWRRRYADFPQPVGGTPTSPAFDLTAVEKWLSARGKLQSTNATERAWREIETTSGGPALGEALWLAGLVLFNRALADGLTTDPLTPESLIEPVRRSHPEAAELLASGLRDDWQSWQQGVLSAAAGLDDDVDPAEAFEDLYALYLSARGGTSDYVTPMGVAQLMVSLAGSVENVMDAACGTGTLLVEVARANSGARCLGQDIDATAARIAQLRLLFAGRRRGGNKSSAQVRVGDSLRLDAFVGERVDLVVCNPPFGLHDWADDQMAFDPRWEFGGLPPRTEPELAWVEDALAHLRPGGLAVMLMPPVAAWRSAGRRIRAELLRRGALRAVIALPPRLLPVTAVGLHLWILRRPLEGRSAEQTLLFDASRVGDGTPAGITDSIVRGWQTFESGTLEEQTGVCKAVPVIDLLDEEVDVSPTRHLAGVDEQGPDPAELLATSAEVLEQLSSLRRRLPTLEATVEARLASVRRVSLEELSRSGGLQILRGVPRIVRDPQESSEPAVTAGDVVRQSAPTGRASGTAGRIEQGDVLMPTIASSMVATVATTEQVGARLGPNVSAVRVNSEILDPWYVAGMLTAPASLREAVQHSSTTRESVRVNLKRLQVPLLPLEEQRPYAEAFRRLAEFQAMLTRATDEAHRLAKKLSAALTAGTLAPSQGP